MRIKAENQKNSVSLSNNEIHTSGIGSDTINNVVKATNNLAEYWANQAEGSAKKAKQSEENASISAENASKSEINVNNALEEVKTIANGFDEHVVVKTNEFDEHTVTKQGEFDIHVTEKQNDFDVNALTLIARYDNNDLARTKAFNKNAEEKQALVDASVDLARKAANGTIEEYPNGSAEYWAGKAEEAASGKVIDDTIVATDKTYSSSKIEAELEKKKNKTITILKNPINDGYYLEGNENANTIYNYVYGDKTSVELAFDDIITNTGEQIYPFETFDKSRNAIFRRNIITKDKVERINIKVDYQGTVTFEPVQFDSVNKDLSNLSEVGEKHFLGNRNITNCITEIPQDIKLELKDGTLTLKAGSKVYLPNGTFKTTTQDFSMKQEGNDLMFIHLVPSQNRIYAGYMTGGTVDSRPSQPIVYASYYNKQTNICEYYDGEQWYEISLPIAIAYRANGIGYSRIDRIFNGFGFIGSTAFALPNVKYLVPNGKNKDGSLNNIEKTIKEVKTFTRTWAAGGVTQCAFIQNGGKFWAQNEYYQQEEAPNKTYALWYKPSENILYYNDRKEIPTDSSGYKIAKDGIFFGYYKPESSKESTKINGWRSLQPFCALDTELSNTSSKLADSFIEKLIPDYSAGIDVSFPFTAMTTGLLRIRVTNDSSTDNKFKINNELFFTASGNAIVSDWVSLHLAKGDVVTNEGPTKLVSKTFYPLKGAN